MAPFPHSYRVAIERRDGRVGRIIEAPAQSESVGPPPQFDGTDAWWSPEHLLLAAIGGCHMTTFMAFADRRELVVGAYQVAVEGTLEKTREGLRFTRYVAVVEVEVADEDVDRVATMLASADKHCIVSQGLKVPVETRHWINGVMVASAA